MNLNQHFEIKLPTKEDIKPNSTFTGFWGNQFDNLSERILSNFYKTKFDYYCNFTNSTITFNCSEQLFMYLKAIHFNDGLISTRIVSLPTNTKSAEYKNLGRLVKNFNEQEWDRVKIYYMYQAVKAKFTSTPELKNVLLNNTNDIIVECSPFDDIWGIKLAKVDKITGKSNDWKNPDNWKGHNLLGFVLMKVKEDIKNNI